MLVHVGSRRAPVFDRSDFAPSRAVLTPQSVASCWLTTAHAGSPRRSFENRRRCKLSTGSNPFSSANENAQTTSCWARASYTRVLCNRFQCRAHGNAPARHGAATPSGNGLKHVIYTFTRASPLVRRPWVDLHPNDEFTEGRSYARPNRRRRGAHTERRVVSRTFQLRVTACHSLSQLHVTACHSFGELQRYERFGSVTPRPTSLTRPRSASRLRSRCTVRRATLGSRFLASANVNEPPSSNAATRMP